ncbi:MAG: hypothetical protein KY469_20840 [Actinobacteria bacterium]|nr:hypothetical protein [Actinomycetota bacterium]
MRHRGAPTASARRAATLVAVVALLAVLPVTPAAADRPIFQDHIRLQHDLHEVPDLTGACGFEVWHEERVNVIQRVYEDGTEEIRLSVHETLVNVATGESVEHLMAGARSLDGTQTVDGDHFVIDLEARHVGLPSHWRKSGEGVLLRDAGLVELDVYVVLDISQDPPELVTEEIEVQVVHGPHPELEMTQEEFFEFVCGALS